ncbi:MAG: CRISPR-associated endonuclease Cas1 [Gammaproteobacteria bacterium]|nr:MAG: CRISPR-associated endonuclease Cas1 [Gammaproteobacteria bacterium]
MHNLPLVQALLPLRSCIVTLRWLADSQPGFLHHVPLHAWVRNLAGSPANFSHYLIVEPLENGHIQYTQGDGYRFRLTAIQGGEALLETVLQQLKKLPGSAKASKAGQHFANNLELQSINDAFEHHAVKHVAELSCFDQNDLWLETAFWARQPSFTLAFSTPARLVRDKLSLQTEDAANKTSSLKGKQRYCRDKDHLTWSLLTQRLTDTLINLHQHHTGERLQRMPWPDAQTDSAVAFWVDHRYAANANGQRKDASGLLAQVHIRLAADFPSELLALLVFGQYTGIGQNRGFGMGQYQLLDEYLQAASPKPGAVKSLLAKALEEQNLAQVVDEAYSRNEASEQDKSALLMQLHQRRQQITQASYRPDPLQAQEIAKPDGGTRLLSIPSWQDRVLQRAVTAILAPTLDQLWMKHSYGYRRGHSRQQARDEINRYIQQGYNWILESDIANFFDTVCWQNLQQRLQLLFPNEPLLSLLMQWITCPRDENETTHHARSKGLPQGAPISPLLANLLLDDLDQDMLAKGHIIIRYADDFVLLFKTEAQAKSALPDIQASLQEHGLDISLEKTQIVPAKRGFRYLGYLFIDGYAIETTKKNREEEQELRATYKPANHTRPIQAIGEREALGTILIVAGEVATLFSEQERLVVEQYDKRHSYCWNSLAAVLLIGPHQITTPALKTAMGKGVPVHFANGFGRYQGVAAGQEPSHLGVGFWLLQTQHLQNTTKALEVSKALVRARLVGQRALLQHRDKQAPELNKYHRITSKIEKADNLEQLRGYEGESAKLLWAFFQRHLTPDWQFSGRNRRPPKDPVNAMLSLGYSFIYSIVDSINRVVGLYPWQGAYHQNKGSHKTLASDLMEPYRYIVERVVLTLINRCQIKPDDFSTTDKGCQMSSEARKTLLNELLVQLTRSSDTAPSLLNSMKDQALSLAISCKTGQTFQAWKPKI